MRLATLFRWTLTVLGTCAALLIVGALAYVLWSSRPSADAQRLLVIHAARETAPERDNAFIYLMGLAAPVGADPLELGRKRVAWLKERVADPATAAADPSGDAADAASQSAGLKEISESCRGGTATRCTVAFDRWVAGEAFTPFEVAMLARYRTLISYPRFFESVSWDGGQPLPPFKESFIGQRIFYVALARAAEAGDTAAVRDALEREARFWREVQRGSDLLIPKMIAIAALRNQFFFGNRILRRLPAGKVADAIPPAWREEFGAAELSLMRVMAGEYAFAAHMLREREAEQQRIEHEYADDEEFEPPDPFDRMLTGMGRRLNLQQRMLNRMARAYVAAGERFGVPLHEYPAVAERVTEECAEFHQFNVDKYVYRVGTLEGMRRAALLAAELRVREVPHADVAAAVLATPLQDPFSREPFTWSAADGTLTFNSPAANGRWRMQSYLY